MLGIRTLRCFGGGTFQESVPSKPPPRGPSGTWPDMPGVGCPISSCKNLTVRKDLYRYVLGLAIDIPMNDWRSDTTRAKRTLRQARTVAYAAVSLPLVGRLPVRRGLDVTSGEPGGANRWRLGRSLKKGNDCAEENGTYGYFFHCRPNKICSWLKHGRVLDMWPVDLIFMWSAFMCICSHC